MTPASALAAHSLTHWLCLFVSVRLCALSSRQINRYGTSISTQYTEYINQYSSMSVLICSCYIERYKNVLVRFMIFVSYTRYMYTCTYIYIPVIIPYQSVHQPAIIRIKAAAPSCAHVHARLVLWPVTRSMQQYVTSK